ncbi:arylsulfatase [Colwellia sp. 6_MG-2023]|uniref:arylsulfatase n=1 Tax=Colwellia sp. 6_MG-2023 TaxID=3062676 RepID=UPI0026E3010E|nr:arylsulfatase [Colwellia sp. 6_MG-2023]MDO6489639.1 arylsulfatase [Colwellia sp. 6_MG-2023]
MKNFKSLVKKNVRTFSFLMVCTLGATGCNTSETAQQASLLTQKRPNIVLLMTDDQGYGDFSMYNNPLVKTPEIEKLASQSHRFTNFHVDPTCSPTRAAIMSGKYSLRAGVWHTVMGRHMLSDEHEILPEILSKAGYNTAIFGKWHLGENYPFRPQDQGFNHVLIHGGGGVGQSPDYWENDQFDDTYFLNGEEREYKGFATDVWFNEAIDFIHDQTGKEAPFFLYLSLNAPHIPWRAPEEYIEPYRALGLPEDMAKFYGMIANIDENVGRLRTFLRNEKIEDNTIFIFMTDNGSSMAAKSNGEPLNWISDEVKLAIEAKTGKKLNTLNNFMREGKASAFEGGHRTPFFISWPNGNLSAPVAIDELAAHFDIMPTLLDLANIDSTDVDTDGISLVPVLKNDSSLPNRTLVVTNQRVLDPDPQRPYSVMQGNWRYVHAEQDGGVELFDITNDPGQTNDLSAQHPDKVAEFSNAYKKWWLHATGKGTPTTRPIIGSKHENPSRLTGMDWLSPNTNQVPWWPGFGDDKWGKGHGWVGNEDKFMVSPWALKVANDGNYTMTLYLHDVPANKVIPKGFAHIQLNGKVITMPVPKGALSVTFNMPLTKGDLDLRAWFDDKIDDSGLSTGLPAFYLYVEKI